MVGAAGFEPATPTPPVWCATGLRYAPTGEPSGKPQGRQGYSIPRRKEKGFFALRQPGIFINRLKTILTPCQSSRSWDTTGGWQGVGMGALAFSKIPN